MAMKQTTHFRQEAVVQWLRQMARNQEVEGLNPGTIYWIDVSANASYNMKRKK